MAANRSIYEYCQFARTDPFTFYSLLFFAAVPLLVAGGELTGTAFAAEQISLRALLVYNAVFSGSVSVVQNTTGQVLDNGGHLDSVNLNDQLRVLAVASIFGVGSGGLTALSESVESATGTSITQLQGQGAFVLSTGRYFGMSDADIDATLAQIQYDVQDAELVAEAQEEAIAASDILGLSQAEDYFDAQLSQSFNSIDRDSQSEDPCHGRHK